MAHYFTREEAEALLPEITLVLHIIQEHRAEMRSLEENISALHTQAMGNGHHLHERVMKFQKALMEQIQLLRTLVEKLQQLGCELKDPDSGLIDFLSLRDGQEIYLCWKLGEERIAFWHYLHTGYAGRQPL